MLNQTKVTPIKPLPLDKINTMILSDSLNLFKVIGKGKIKKETLLRINRLQQLLDGR